MVFSSIPGVFSSFPLPFRSRPIADLARAAFQGCWWHVRVFGGVGTRLRRRRWWGGTWQAREGMIDSLSE